MGTFHSLKTFESVNEWNSCQVEHVLHSMHLSMEVSECFWQMVNAQGQRQSEVKPVTCSPALSRVNCELPLFTSSSDWFLGLSVCKCSLVIGQRYNFGGLALLVSLEITHNYPALKAVVIYFQDRGFNSFAESMTKRSVNIRKWTVLFARTCAFIF